MKKFVARDGLLMVVSGMVMALLLAGCGSDSNPSVAGTGGYSVGGTISGLISGESVTLQNNGGDDLAISADGSFTFATNLADGDGYAVTVGTQPTGGTCTVANGTGTVSGQNVTGITVTCAFSGYLDVTLDSDGRVRINDPLGVQYPDEYANDVAVDSQGRIIVVGSLFNGTDLDMALWRFNDDGTPDANFGTNGLVTASNVAGGNGPDVGFGVYVDGNDNIYVAGKSYGVNSNNDMVVWKYDATGTPVTGFGPGGFVVWDTTFKGTSLGHDEGHDITVDSQGRILVAGYVSNGTDNDLAVWRLDATGGFDSTFGSGGMVELLSVAGGAGNDYGNALDLDGSDNVYVAGHSDSDASSSVDYDMVLVKLSASDGSLDTSFGSNGIVVQKGNPIAGSNDTDMGTGVVVQGSSVYVSGWMANHYTDSNSQQVELNQAVIWSFSTADGAADTTFGSVGVATVSSSADAWLYGLAFDANGNLLTCGYDNSDLAVWRFTSAGALDAGFGVNGKGSVWTRKPNDAPLNGLAIDSLGRVDAVGNVYDTTSRYDALLVRMNNL